MPERRKDNKGRVLRNGELQRADGRYEYRFIDGSGTRRSVYSWRLTAADVPPAGKRDCEPLRDIEKRIQRDLDAGLVLSKQTLNARWDAYLALRTDLKITSRQRYMSNYDRYIRGTIGEQSISDITREQMRALLLSMHNDMGLSASLVSSVCQMLHPLFRQACRGHILRENPLEDLLRELKRTGDWTTPHRRGLSESEQKEFVRYIRETPRFAQWDPLITCLLGTGCRIGEMLGLCWRDVDWEGNTITICKTLSYLNTREGAHFVLTTPKSQSSRRSIPMFKSVREALLKEQNRQQTCGIHGDELDGYSDFIWHMKSGKLMRAVYVDQLLTRIINAHNAQEGVMPLPHISAHQLRHTFCMRLCERETDLKLIQEIMGHASITTTMDIYNDVTMERKQSRFERLERNAEDIF